MTSSRSLAIDLLRGLAILMVMLCHLPFSSVGAEYDVDWEIFPPQAISSVLAYGHYGVQLFLVISGFCIHLRWAKGRVSTGQDEPVEFIPFWKRRFLRLYPAYLVALSLTITLAHLGGALRYTNEREFAFDLVAHLTQTQNLTGAPWRIGNGVFWSLALEEQLYLLYFPLLFMRRRWGWNCTLLAITGINVCWILAAPAIGGDMVAGWLRAAPAYWLPWALGALAAEAWVGLIRIPVWTSSPLSGILLFLLASQIQGFFKTWLITIGFFFLLRYALEGWKLPESLPWGLKLLFALGTISYSVYLVHNLAFVVSKRLLLMIPFQLSPWVVLSLRFLSGLCAGAILYFLVEKRTMKMSGAIPTRSRMRLSSECKE